MLCENKKLLSVNTFLRGKIINGLLACKNKNTGSWIHMSLLKSCKKRNQYVPIFCETLKGKEIILIIES